VGTGMRRGRQDARLVALAVVALPQALPEASAGVSPSHEFLRNATMGPQGFVYPVFTGPGRAFVASTSIVYRLLRRVALVCEY
jgi:hypothetical protein